MARRDRQALGAMAMIMALLPVAAAGSEFTGEILRDLYLTEIGPQEQTLAVGSDQVAPDVRSAGWSPLFGAPPTGAGMSSSVNALTVYNGGLIVAGDFLRAGGATVGRVAAWDGASWSAFRTGLNDRAFALTVWNGLLVVGGQFLWADGLQVGGVAAWDGVQWSALGGPGGATYALTTYQGQLVAGGTFAGGVKIWNGSTWVAPGTTGGAPGLPGVVLALTTYSAGGVEYLVAGGIFSSAGLNNIAKWNGTAWSALRSGTSDWVHALCARNDTLFVGGRFDFVDATISCRGIARWVPNTAGSGSWSAIGNATGPVLALHDYAGSLVAGGDFASISGSAVNQVGAWDGVSWNAFGPGTGGAAYRPLVRCLTEYNNTLYAGGWFTTAGGVASRFLGNWTSPPPHPANPHGRDLGPVRVGTKARLAVAPNPFTSATRVAFAVGETGPVHVAIYDSAGRLVTVLADDVRSHGRYSVQWDGRGRGGNKAPSGVYFLSLRTSSFGVREKVVLLRP